MFKKVLVANRGEIAVRVLRACRELGIPTVAIYSKADARSRHVEVADEAICVGAGSNADSYLNLANVLMAIEISGSDAVHPGYGYFSERALFAEAVADMGVKFIGPTVSAIQAMGDKARAKQAAIEAKCPVVPGSQGEVSTEAEAAQVADQLGYPALLKAVAGGGGRGIRRVNSREELSRSWDTAATEAQASFGSGAMIVEKCVERARHVEVQIMGDEHGEVIHLGERECSVQNLRHQKIIEESPCAVLDEDTRQAIGSAAVRVARQVGYTSAGTVEFLLDSSGAFYFLEMNTRIQVEHPVTEEVTDTDLVKAQLRIAAGQPLEWKQEQIRLSGHAIEARITSQDPDRDFAPSTGVVTAWHPPGFRGIRLDTHIYAGFEVSPFYDPMIAKLIVRGRDRDEAVRRLRVALADFVVEGIHTNIGFLRRIVDHPSYVAGDVDIGFVARMLEEGR